MASSPRSTFLLHISLILLLHSQTLTAFSQNLFFHFPPFSNKNLVLLGSSSLRDGSLCLTNGSLSSSSFGAAIFLNPVAIIPLVSFSTSFSFLVTNPDQDLTSSSRNAITFFLLPNSSIPALFQSPDAIKNASILFLEFPISRYLKAASVNHITARISIHYKEDGMAVRVSAGEPRIMIKEESQIFILKHFVEHIYAGFFSSNQNSFESHVIKSWSLSSSIFHGNNPQRRTWRIKLQSTKALKYSPSNTLLNLIRASILAISAAVIIVACFNVKEQFSPDARKRKRERQLLLKDFRKFKYSEIVTGTMNFNEIIGFGGTSKVYKMNFPLSSSIFYAVKRFNTDKKSRKSYHNELETISRVRHENILELKGWCDMDTGENLLVFDYMPKGSLHYVLHSRKNQLLPWTQRYAIAIKLATALKHLHEECSPYIVHGDIKGSNILLDDEYELKLGDFGISLNGAPYKPVGASKQYSAPECKPNSVLDVKADVYSYGVLVLEICRGSMPKDTAEGFVSEVSEMESEDRLLEAADERLGGCFNPEEMMKLLKVGLACTVVDRERRPTMAWVLKVLNGEVELEEMQKREAEVVESVVEGERRGSTDGKGKAKVLVFGVKAPDGQVRKGFSVIGEYMGGHDRNVVVLFGDEPPCSKGTGHNRLPVSTMDSFAPSVTFCFGSDGRLTLPESLLTRPPTGGITFGSFTDSAFVTLGGPTPFEVAVLSSP
ncbi:hypothetical protein M5K25_021283 [Dendrobium thyrsiflorum]|uniref:Protein kinase domain-containing protein n=1 Tax=Dendrobium thyrsiflorum TaxID=117978 RepID=A0ABD0UC09_DENTH